MQFGTVAQFLLGIQSTGDDLLLSSLRYRVNTSDGGRTRMQKQLTTKEIETIQWIQRIQPCFELQEMTTCGQQKRGRYKVFVIKFNELISSIVELIGIV